MPCFFKRLLFLWLSFSLLIPGLVILPVPAFATSSISFTENATLNDPTTGGNFFGINGMIIGDINGDGYHDLFIPASLYSTNTGGLYVYFGGSTLDTTADITISGENSNNNFPALNGGIGVTDLNKDGYADIIGGSYRYNTRVGRGYIFFGSSNPSSSINASAADVIFNGNSTTMKGLGESSAVGDFNGDGSQDLAIASIYANTNQGAVQIYYGNGTKSFSATPDKSLVVSGSSSLGAGDMRVGDFNGDGYDDVIVSDGYTTKGKVYIFYGGSSMSTSYGVKFTGETTNDYLTTAAAVGDINHDGYDDVCMGAYENSTDFSKAGRVYCIFGSSTLSGDYAIATKASLIYSGAAANDDFGRSTELYDVNNDGNLDLIVGAYQTDGSKNGYVNIYFGNGTTLDTTADIIINASDIGESGKYFGNHVFAGDIRNNGWPQLFITSAGASDSTGAKVHILEPNHGTPSISASVSGANTTTPKVTGTASDSTAGYTISNVQWSTQNTTYGSSGDNVWTSCTANDGSFNSSSEGFTCDMGTEDNGSKTVYLRSVDQNGMYMSPKLYGSVGFIVDSNGPKVDWTTSNGDKITFNNYYPENNTYTEDTLPTFKFIKAGDGTAKISKYQVVMTNNLPNTDPNHFENKVYLDNIDPDPPNKSATVDQYGKAYIHSGIPPLTLVRA